MSKGLRQTKGPQLLVRPRLGAGPLYLGAQLKNLDEPADAELLTHIGAKGRLGGFALDANLQLKLVVGLGQGDKGALELSAAASRRVGPVEWRLQLFASPDDIGPTGRSVYAQASAAIILPGRIELSGAVGRRERRSGVDYASFNLGLSREVDRVLTLDLRYHDTAESGRGVIYRGRLVASARASF